MIGYFLLNPLMIMLLCKYVAWISDIKYLYIFSIYGYSFTTFILTIPLTVIEGDWVNWVVLGYSGCNSMLAIFIEMYDLIKAKLKANAAKFFLVALWLVGTHAVFILALNKYFLN